MLTDFIRQEARRKGVNASELARRVGCSPQQMSRFLNGKTELSAGKLNRLAEVLNLKIAT